MSKKGKKSFHSKKEKFNRPWQEESPVKAKKHLGQHFLKDEAVAKKIGETLKLNGYRNVIEIGPGTGCSPNICWKRISIWWQWIWMRNL